MISFGASGLLARAALRAALTSRAELVKASKISAFAILISALVNDEGE
jgi:hypothetical protein